MILSVCLAYTGKSKYLRKLMFGQMLDMSGQKIYTLGENVPTCDQTKQPVLSQLQECIESRTLLQLFLSVYQRITILLAGMCLILQFKTFFNYTKSRTRAGTHAVIFVFITISRKWRMPPAIRQVSATVQVRRMNTPTTIMAI